MTYLKTIENDIINNFIAMDIIELDRINKKYLWSLNIKELKKAQDYFKKLGRNPARAEMETIAQTWSEHCKHKTFSGPVKLLKNGCEYKFKNLFKETIVYATEKLNKKWCLSVFKDNAGIIELESGSKWAIAFKAETHNHPCAIEPYGGAETGVGGVIRDILGVGLGAKPVLNTDNFCFGPLYEENMPKGFLRPKRIFDGVVEGVRDYGNRMGIPTAAGSIYFDKGYLFNPLVYVGCVGIMPKNKIEKKVKRGDLIVVIGGPTGRDGIHGATFSSADIEDASYSSAVQIGHAINEKKCLDVIMKARDLNLYNAITDCGAGGFSSAIGELGSQTGAIVELSNAILKDKNISPWEIWVSESQERMVLSVSEDKINKLKEICKIEECPICVLGNFRGGDKLIVNYKGKNLINLDMSFLHGGIPKMEKLAVYNDREVCEEIEINERDNNKILEKLICDENVCSRRSVIEQYDHEVQGGTAIKPFCGPEFKSPSDGSIIWPHSATGELNNFSGFAISHGFNCEIGKISPYKMAFYAIDEAFRNLTCLGAEIDKVALLDNFCSANPDEPNILGDFAMAAIGCRDAALAYRSPFISGKDSFYNQSKINGKNYPIPLSLLISALASVKDVRKVITSDFKEAGNPIYLIGMSVKGLGGSVYSKIYKSKNNYISSLNPKENLYNFKKISASIMKGIIISAHDVSQGGMAVALAEMCFGNMGCVVDTDKILKEQSVSEVELLFGEGGSKIIVEVAKNKENDFLRICDRNVSKLGYVEKSGEFIIKNKGKVIIKEKVKKLFELWDRSLN
jgi:phosphoribosylformylglycinamidine synthase